MKSGKKPDPNVIHPIAGYDKEIYVKPTIRNPNISVGDFLTSQIRSLRVMSRTFTRGAETSSSLGSSVRLQWVLSSS